MEKDPAFHYLDKADIVARANQNDNSIQIWACGGSPVPPNKKVVWTIDTFDGTKRSLTATVQECKPGGSSPVLSDVKFTLHNAAISADGKTVRLIFEHDGDKDVAPYASVWLASNGVQ